jgi:hypothetical protein
MRRHPIYFPLITGLGLLLTLFLPTDKTLTRNTPTSLYRAEFLEEVAYDEQSFAHFRSAVLPLLLSDADADKHRKCSIARRRCAAR